MTLLSVVKDVCATVGVLVPQSVFSNISGNRTMQEMLTVANESAQSIAYDNREWTALRTTATLAGDGISEGFNLPANYKRMLLRSSVWRSTQTQSPMQFIPDADRWLQRRAQGYYDGYGEWTIYGGKIHIQPIMTAPVYDVLPPGVNANWQNSHHYRVNQKVRDAVDDTVWIVQTAHNTGAAPLTFAQLRAQFPIGYSQTSDKSVPPWANGIVYDSLGERVRDIVDSTTWEQVVIHTSAATGTFAADRLANPTYWRAITLPVVISPAQTATFNYLDKNCINLASGGYGDRFMADNDSFRLEERLLKLYMIWRWKALKGGSYAEDLSTFNDALNSAAGADAPSPIIIGRVPMMPGVSLAYPWQVPTP